MKRLLMVGLLVAAAGAVGLSTQVAAEGARDAGVQAAQAAVDARQRQVLGGLLRAARAGALAQR
jgi:hypothetical protein